jgi:hypothetical protein
MKLGGPSQETLCYQLVSNQLPSKALHYGVSLTHANFRVLAIAYLNVQETPSESHRKFQAVVKCQKDGIVV